MGRLYLIRHGQASLGSDNYDQLSQLGKQQAFLLGEYFQQHQIIFDHILCGSQVRHEETAQHFLQGYQADDNHGLITLPEFNEFDFGSIIRAYLQANPNETIESYSGPALFQLLKKSLLSWSKGELSLDQHESWQAFQSRIAKGLAFIQTEFCNQNCLLFTSGGPISQVMSLILGLSDPACIELNLQIQNTSISQCLISSNKIKLDSFNALAHLQAPDRMALRSYS